MDGLDHGKKEEKDTERNLDLWECNNHIIIVRRRVKLLLLYKIRFNIIKCYISYFV